MDSIEKMEEYLASVEQHLFSSLTTVSNGLPDVHEVLDRLWVDISRYGPALPEMSIPSLGDFQVPPPPLPVQASRLSNTGPLEWIERHPWKASGLALGVVGASLLIGYRVANAKRKPVYRVKSQTHERRQVVVILGGDSPFALPLILDLEKKGYLVVASVSEPELVDVLEKQCHGYVNALVLDPHEPASVPVFMRSLTATLSRRFPLSVSGDAPASPASLPYIQSVISLLGLIVASPGIHAPLEHINLSSAYLPYLTATHVTPLQVIQMMLPLLRTGPARSQDKGKKTVIVCLPAIDARVGLPFASVQAMSAAGTLRGVEVLRRELKVSALTDRSESMKNISVVVVDVGRFSVDQYRDVRQESIYKAMEHWSASEKVIYGPAFAASFHELPPPMTWWQAAKSMFQHGAPYGVQRKPTDISVFVRNITGVVNRGRSDGFSIFGVGLGRIQNWFRGERFSVGAGATTYHLASQLPSFVLDALLNIPHILAMLRNRLLTTEPFRRNPFDLPQAPTNHPGNQWITPSDKQDAVEEVDVNVDVRSEPDSESASGDHVGRSWVRLQRKKHHEA